MSDVRYRSGGFFIVRNDLFPSILKDVGPTGFTVYCCLLRRASDGTCFPSHELIGEECGISAERVRGLLRDLRKHKYVTAQPRFDADGRQTSNLYIIEDMGRCKDDPLVTDNHPEAVTDNHHPPVAGNHQTRPSKEEDPEEQDTTDVASPCKQRTASQTSVVPRAADEVREFANDAGLDATEADGFFDYWQSVGWRRGGRSPIKDWHAAYRNWLRQARKFVAGGSQNGGGLAARAEYYNDRIRKDPQLAGLFFGDPGGYALNTG